MNPFDAAYSARAVIDASGLLAKKSLGQHFLHDENVLRKIIAAAGPFTSSHVIEIGPGPGVLTRLLAEARPQSLTAVDIDPRVIEHLLPLTTLYPDAAILHQDAMKLDLSSLVPAPRIIVSNLPYNIGTLLLAGWLKMLATEGPDAISRMVLMFQKEVAERVLAAPNSKEYGRISVLAQWLCRVDKLFDVTPQCFFPAPKVMSSVIRLEPLLKPRAEASLPVLEKVLQAAFGQRRKMLRGALKSLRQDSEVWLADAGIDETRRAETLSVEEFCRLAAAL